MRFKIFFLTAMVLLFVSAVLAAQAAEEDNAPFFEKSLHFTGQGMRYWYEAEDGFMKITEVPYDLLS